VEVPSASHTFFNAGAERAGIVDFRHNEHEKARRPGGQRARSGSNKPSWLFRLVGVSRFFNLVASSFDVLASAFNCIAGGEEEDERSGAHGFHYGFHVQVSLHLTRKFNAPAEHLFPK
jgi:hypothetical protein